MKTRSFGPTGRSVSEVGFGAWAIGGTWGEVSEEQARVALHAALDAGTTFIDTADVYGDGRSERIIADVLKERDGDRPFVATKAGRRLDPHVTEGFTKEKTCSQCRLSTISFGNAQPTCCSAKRRHAMLRSFRGCLWRLDC